MAANDDFDAGWGDDPFSGDMDFDMDFDSPSKKGFLRSFASGFLSGITSKTIGDTDARINTLKMVLPRTYTGAFSTLTMLNQRRREVLDEIKGGTFESVKDLQYLAGRAATKLRKTGPNRIADSFQNFSQNDFSDWEKKDYSGGDSGPSLQETTDEDVASALANNQGDATLQRDAMVGVGEAVTGMMAEVGGRTLGQLSAMNLTGARTNQLLEQIIDHQRRVQARNDAMKLNIMTRSFLTDAKFYKFMEASNHRMIQELKGISEWSKKSDYEKTTHSQAMRKSIRDSVFNTTKSKLGGIASFVNEKFGKGARTDFSDSLGEITGALRMASEMTEGAEINLGDMIGNAAAGLFINNLPKLGKTAAAQRYLAKFKAQFPKFSKWADDAYIRITDLGNVATYNLGNMEGTVNTLRRHYKGSFNNDEPDSYDEYLATLPAGQAPLSKVEWTVLHNVRKASNKAINGLMESMSTSQGSRFNLTRRTLDDGQEQQLWNRRSDRTLNEVLPQWLSQIHLSIEKFRTGNDDLRAMTYDYTKAKFIGHDQKAASTLNQVFDKRQFSSQAEMARRLAEDIDTDGALSEEAKRALAYRLARDTDADMGFSPYNYLKGENDGLPPAVAAEIRDLMKREFGLTDDHIKEFFDDANPAKMTKALTYLPTEKGREKAANIFSSAQSLGAFIPDIANRLDVLKSSGYYDALKGTGIIKDENGTDVVDSELFWKTLQDYIADPKRSTAPMPADAAPGPSRPFGGPPQPFPPFPPMPTPPPAPPSTVSVQFPDVMKVKGVDKIVSMMELMTKEIDKRGKRRNGPTPPPQPLDPKDYTNVLTEIRDDLAYLTYLEDIKKDTGHLLGIKESIDLLGRGFAQGARGPEVPPTDLKPVTDGLDAVKANLLTLIDLAGTRNETLDKILLRQPPEGKPTSESDEQIIDQEKRGLLDRLKQTNFRDMFNGSVDKILDNQPLVLGGLLGGLAGLAVYNPKGAALIAGGAAAATAYGKLRSMTAARRAKATEDLYEEGSDVPILESFKLQRGDYLDMATGVILTSWEGITGSVKDITNGTIIGGRKLAKKLFNAENKEVFLSGLNKLREGLIKAFRWLDPLNRLTGVKNKLVNRFYQMDVYKEGADSPTLVGKRFATGAYWKRTEAGELEQINGWNEINGPVYDAEGNVLITQEEYDMGLKTSMGASVNKLQAASATAGRFGLDFLRKIKDKVNPLAQDGLDKAKSAFKADYTPVISSVDRIYHLLLKHWGYKAEEESEVLPDPAPPSVDDKPADAPAPAEEAPAPGDVPVLPRKPNIGPKGKMQETIEAIGDKLTGKTPEGRLNSLQDRAAKAEEKKDNTVKDSIIHIAQSFGFGNKDEGEKKKKSGLFGMLLSGIGMMTKGIWGLSTFFTRTIFKGLGTLFNFAGMGLKVLPAIGTGIAALAKGMLTLLKTRSLTQAGGATIDSIRNRRRRPRPGDPEVGPPRPRPPRNNFATGAKIMGAGMAVGLASDALLATGAVDEGSVTDKVLGVVETAGTVAGGVQMAGAAASALGFNVAGWTAAATAAAGTVGTTLAGWGGAAMAAAAPLLFNPVTLGIAAVGLAGYGIYKFVTRGEGKQLELRMVQYGVADTDSDLAKKLLKAEEMLTPFVVIGNGRASLSKNAPIQEVMKMFVTDPQNQKELGDVFTWFNGRVKPVMLTYLACLDVVKIKSLKEYDESKSQDVYKVAKQVNEALNGMQPYPYSIVAKVDADIKLLGEKATKIRCMTLLEELKSYIDRKTDDDDLKGVETLAFRNTEGLQKEKAELQAKLNQPGSFGKGSEARDKREAARVRLGQVDEELRRLNTTYKAGEVVQQVYVSDLLPENKAMDLLTAIRVACYGNEEDLAWRVEAVLKLERYCEQFFRVTGDNVEFTGQIGDLFNLFKDSFRLDKGDADDWCLWFRDRFLPVMSNYVKGCNNYRRGRPGVVWKTLTATARYEIAKQLIETRTNIPGSKMDYPVWNVRVAPFKDAVSPAKPDKVTRMLKLLGEASTVAKLKDPEGEAGRTNASSWANAVAPHKVGGGFTKEAANVQDVSKARTRGDVLGGGQFGTNGGGTGNTYTGNGVYMTPANKYGFTPLKGESDTSHLDMSGVQQQQGNDKGVSVPKKLAQQILIREMLKAGFTDPRAIAEMLALTDYESGGYSRTTENMKYSSPAQLVRMFREVRDLNQARQLVEAGEVAIANTVYGGGKGASIGNTQPGDGWRYRGRGFVQLTGRANYAKIGRQLGIDLENNPELASNDPNVMAQVAVQFFKNSKMLQSITQTGNFGEAAKGLNGGNELPGMPQRYQLYLRYLDQLQKGTLGADGDTAPAEAPNAANQTAGGMYGGQAANDPGRSTGPATGGGAPAATMPTPAASGPMLGGGGAMPSLVSSPSGGQVGGGEPLVGNNSTGAGGLRLKSAEAVAGGQSHPGVTALAKIIQQRVAGFRYFTALNDAYHHSKPGNSKHKSGLALDFTLTNGIAGSDAAAAQVTEILRTAGLTPAEFKVINEYRTRTANGTGGHVHAHFMSAEAAQKFYQASGGSQTNTEDTSTGEGAVSPQDTPNRAQPAVPPLSGEDDAPVGPGTGIPAAAASPRGMAQGPATPQAPTPLPTTPSAAQQAPEGYRAPPVAQPVAAQPPAAQDNAALADALNKLATAMQTTGGAQAELMKQAVEQLIQLNKKGAAPAPSVKLG
jgi:predicted chitinase